MCELYSQIWLSLSKDDHQFFFLYLPMGDCHLGYIKQITDFNNERVSGVSHGCPRDAMADILRKGFFIFSKN